MNEVFFGVVDLRFLLVVIPRAACSPNDLICSRILGEGLLSISGKSLNDGSRNFRLVSGEYDLCI